MCCGFLATCLLFVESPKVLNRAIHQRGEDKGEGDEKANQRLGQSAQRANSDKINLWVTRSWRFSVLKPPGNSHSRTALRHERSAAGSRDALRFTKARPPLRGTESVPTSVHVHKVVGSSAAAAARL